MAIFCKTSNIETLIIYSACPFSEVREIQRYSEEFRDIQRNLEIFRGIQRK